MLSAIFKPAEVAFDDRRPPMAGSPNEGVAKSPGEACALYYAAGVAEPPIIDQYVLEPTRGVIEPGRPLPPKQSAGWIWALVAAGGITIVALGGLLVFGSQVLADEVCDELALQRAVTDRLGAELECSVDWGGTASDTREQYFHYSVTGDRGSGTAIVHSEPNGSDAAERLVDGEFFFDDQRFALTP